MFASNKTAVKPAPKNTTSSAKSTPDSSQASTQTSTKPAATKTAPLKREGSSLFKAFAKARPKAQDQPTDSSAEPSPAVDSKATEDGMNRPERVLMQELTITVDPMDGLSDEEADDEDTAMLDDGALTETGGKSKKEREDELRRMMDMEGKNHLIPLYHSCPERLTRCRTDEPMVDAPAKTTTADASEDAEDEPESKSEAQTKPEPEETVTVTDGRRRGRRRVMKKKTVQDEEGYLGMSSCIKSNSAVKLTIVHSNTGRSRLGVFFRRRARAQESKGLGCTHHRKGQEGCCSKGTGKHHVLLLQEIELERVVVSGWVHATVNPYVRVACYIYRFSMGSYDTICNYHINPCICPCKNLKDASYITDIDNKFMPREETIIIPFFFFSISTEVMHKVSFPILMMLNTATSETDSSSTSPLVIDIS
jgi:hypothetical protein